MKTPANILRSITLHSPRMLLLSAIACGFALSSTVHAASNHVVIDLQNLVIKSGTPPSASSEPNAINAAAVYDYNIDANINCSQLGISNKPIADVLSEDLHINDPESFLTGRVFNPGAKLPFTVVNKTKKGKFKFGPFTVTGSVIIKVGITKDGFAGFKTKLLGFQFTGVPNVQFTFTSGSQVTVDVDNTADPDLYTKLANGTYVGKGVDSGSTSTKIASGKSKTFTVTLKNNSSLADVFTISANSLPTGFSQTVTVKGQSTPLSLPAAVSSLDPLKSTTLIWKISNDSATSGDIANAVLTATSHNDNGETDTLEVDATAK